MPAQLIDGRAIAKRITGLLKAQVSQLTTRYHASPTLVSVFAGDNADSLIYTHSQRRLAESLGIVYRLHRCGQETTHQKLFRAIRQLSDDPAITGIIIQLPLPRHLDINHLIYAIDPQKDVEGLHPENMGGIIFGRPRVISCSAQAVMRLIESTGVRLYGKEAVMVGHNDVVGKPTSLLLLKQFATTTVCHIATSHRAELENHVRRAEILVVAVGKPRLVKGAWIRKGAVVIDVGINRVGKHIVGDVEFEEAKRRASFITPVPGGVGPVTVSMLMRNVVEVFKAQHAS